MQCTHELELELELVCALCSEPICDLVFRLEDYLFLPPVVN
jgi:hypothetical protein